MIIKNNFRNILQKAQEVKKVEPKNIKPEITSTVVNPVSVRSATVPRNIRVNSGQNEELAWMSKTSGSEVDDHDENYEVKIRGVHERTFSNDKFEDGVNRSVPIAYDDVPSPPDNTIEQKNAATAQFSDINVGEYVLIFDNEILGAGTLKEVSDAIETILLSDSSGSIMPESLVVLKRMQVITGVLIKDA